MKAIDPFTIIIFGSTGDLTKRYLIPALHALHKKKVDFNIIAIGRRNIKQSEFYSFATEHIRPSKGFSDRISYFIADFKNQGQICLIPEYLKKNMKKNIICYLATSPNYFEPIVTQLNKCGFIKKDRDDVKIVFEKPFGNDLRSAKKLNRVIGRLFKEKQIYRTDHYLGKESVQNLLVLRFANQLFEQVWNRDYIEKVHIYAEEKVGVVTRGGYYDSAGALKDMCQNHLMQTLSLVAMDAPKEFNEKSVRDEKVKVVKSLRRVKDLKNVVKGQYAGYLSEDKVGKGSKTETYVALKAFIDNKRWKGVPFILETGKFLAKKEAGVDIYFKPVANVFNLPLKKNKMTINIQPEGDIDFMFNTRDVGSTLKITDAKMTFCNSCEIKGIRESAYEKLIHDIANGDQTLFVRADEIEASWKFIDDISRRWKKQKIYRYKKGTNGPKEKEKIIS